MASTSTSDRGEVEQKHDPFSALEPPCNKKIKSPLTAKQYYVFINHRGPDTKTNLAQQLYDSLQQVGIPAYLDAPETELGDYFPSAIKNAIFSAAVHIAILSPQYAGSPWCLAELALMFQSKARIIPLFYNVQPSDFRFIKNGVDKAFYEHEKKGRYPNHDIQQWKECLQNVSWLKGYELNRENDNLSKLCKEVVSAVVNEKEKRKIPLQVAKYEVGLDELRKDVYSHCQRNGQMRDKIIGVFGMGGSGKTTLAKYLFNRTHSEFSRSTILFDVRENYVQGKLTSLQSKLHNDLFPTNPHSFSSIEEGSAYIKHELERSQEARFLIVIDDVDHQNQLDALLPTHALNPNSLVIVTTRDLRLLINAGVTVRYKMKEMNAEHSRELFCRHAFHRQSCRKGFEKLVDSFVQACGGLPLALKVMGGHVSGSNMAYWESQLEEVKARPDRDIQGTLKISYDALEEDKKQIFMDIACFFIGKGVSMATSIWKASGWRVKHALQTLKDKCLVDVEIPLMRGIPIGCHYEPSFVFKMHDHLRDLGREMADKEMSQATDKQMSHPRRLWRPQDLIGMSEIKGFQDTLAGSEGKSFRCYGILRNFGDDSSDIHEDAFDMRYFLGSSKTSTDIQLLELDSHSSDLFVTIPEWFPLQNLHSLSLSYLSPARLCQRDDQVLLKLKELYCSFDYMQFSDPNLEDMFRSDLNALMSSLGRLKNLQSLHIDFGYNFSSWNIEWNCLLKSVRELTTLQTLRLGYLKVEGEFALSNRGKITDNRFCTRSLEAIILCKASKATKVSISGQFCPTLKSVKLCSIEDLIEVDLTGVTTLECLVLSNCQNLREVLGNDLLQLEMFQIKYCSTIRKLPNFGRVSCLKRIYINCCQNLQYISAIESLKGLKRIFIAYCPELKSIKAIEQLKGLKRIWIQECPRLEGVICFQELKKVERIFIANCARLQSMEGIEYLTCLESIIIAHCPKLKNIGGLEELIGLKEIVISDSPMLSCVKRLQILPSQLTTMVGRSALSDYVANEIRRTSSMSYFNADKICDTLSTVDAFCEIDWMEFYFEERRKQIKEMINKFSKTNPSLKRFIFCAVVKVFPRWAGSFELDISDEVKPINLFRDNGDWVYICVGNEERLSECDSWIESPYEIEKAFLMGVEAGEERETLRILQSLFAQLCIHTNEYSEEELQHYSRGDKYSVVDYNDLVNHIEEVNGCDDDDDDDDETDYIEEEDDDDDDDDDDGGGGGSDF